MIGIEDDHDWSIGYLSLVPDGPDDPFVHRTAEQKRDPRVLELMHALDINGDDSTLTEQVEQIGEVERRTAAVRPALDEQCGTHRGEHLLDRPCIEHVLPDR